MILIINLKVKFKFLNKEKSLKLIHISPDLIEPKKDNLKNICITFIFESNIFIENLNPNKNFPNKKKYANFSINENLMIENFKIFLGEYHLNFKMINDTTLILESK